MSIVLHNNEQSEQIQRILNNKDVHKDRDIDQFHQNIIESMKISTLRQQSQDHLEQSWLPYRRLLKFLSQLTYIPSYIFNNYVRTIVFLVLLGLMFPLNLLITLFTCILSSSIHMIQYKRAAPMSNVNRKRILISGGRTTKALHLCRSFYRAGHQIILVDESLNWLTGHRWSNTVERFYVHPSPSKESNAYIKTLANIVRKEKINIFIPTLPSCNAQIDVQLTAALAAHGCSIFDVNMDGTTVVDNEYTFIDKARSLSLTVPQTFLITSRHQLLNFDFDKSHCLYICKSARFDYLPRRVMIKLPQSTRTETVAYINKLAINEDCPYILQEFISGKEYSTHVTCINGQLKLFTCSYSSSSNLIYKHVEQPVILDWCTEYIRAGQLTGHISFDFIVSDCDGKAYAIGCYPSVNSAITSFYNHPHVADAYFANEISSFIVPLATARSTYWLPHELWHLFRNIRSRKNLIRSLKTIVYGKEAIWAWHDPLPFLFHYHIHILYLLFHNLFSRHVRFFQKIDCSIGTLA